MVERRGLTEIGSCKTFYKEKGLALINASSSATAAETDIAIRVYEVLAALGLLSLEAIRDRYFSCNTNG